MPSPLRGLRVRASQLLALAEQAALSPLESAGFDFLIVREDDSVLGADALDTKAAALIAASIPALGSLGVFISVDLTRYEPFNIAREATTIDILTNGRAGLAVQAPGDVSRYAAAGIHYSDLESPTVWVGEAIDVIRGLWESWEPDAVVRKWPTNQFVDAQKVHPIEFEGEYLAIRGPAATPRSPQGELPLLADLAAGDWRDQSAWAGKADLVALPHTEAAQLPTAQRVAVFDLASSLPETLGTAAGIVFDASEVAAARLDTLQPSALARARELDERFGSARRPHEPFLATRLAVAR